MTEERIGPNPFLRGKLVYEVVASPPSWSRLNRLAIEKVADMATRAIVSAVESDGRINCEPKLLKLRDYFCSELPASALKEVLDVCIARDRLRCHHNPTDCLALEFWRVFYHELHQEINIVHHEFAFPKTSNYPDIVQNLGKLLQLMAVSQSTKKNFDNGNIYHDTMESTSHITTSFKLELKQCELGHLLEDKVAACLVRLNNLRVLEIPGLASDQLLLVIAHYCTNLEVLNLKGSREQITDSGFNRFVETAKCRAKIKQLDITRCSLSQQILLSLKHFEGLLELKVRQSDRKKDQQVALTNSYSFNPDFNHSAGRYQLLL